MTVCHFDCCVSMKSCYFCITLTIVHTLLNVFKSYFSKMSSVHNYQGNEISILQLLRLNMAKDHNTPKAVHYGMSYQKI